eukprot:scaffold5184_cov39-Cyclotella_meneghiniana.AAC.5
MASITRQLRLIEKDKSLYCIRDGVVASSAVDQIMMAKQAITTPAGVMGAPAVMCGPSRDGVT